MSRAWLLAPLLVALVACGSGGDGDESAGGSPSQSSPASSGASAEDELEEAYRAYIKAFLTGDGATAYQLLSQRCQESEPLSEFAAITESAAELYGEVDYTIDSITVDGDEGQVDATYAVEALNSGGGSVWVYEDGGWRSDKCG